MHTSWHLLGRWRRNMASARTSFASVFCIISRSYIGSNFLDWSHWTIKTISGECYSQTGCSFPRNIATLLGILQFWLRDCSEQVATDVIKLQVEIHNQICKQSLWLATSSKEGPIKYSEQMHWFFFATSRRKKQDISPNWYLSLTLPLFLFSRKW
jgi:hypothetical protein